MGTVKSYNGSPCFKPSSVLCRQTPSPLLPPQLVVSSLSPAPKTEDLDHPCLNRSASGRRGTRRSRGKVKGTDGGVLLSKDGHKEVADVALQLQKYCIDEPVKCLLIFGVKRSTSPGGGYGIAFGCLGFKTNEMVQVVEAPDAVRNMVSLRFP